MDGAVVMVENIFRELAERHGKKYNLVDVIRARRATSSGRSSTRSPSSSPAYLPIYVLTGPSGRLFRPMADTMSFALLGSLLCSLTLLPVLCAYFLRKHDQGARRSGSTTGSATPTAGCSPSCLRHRAATMAVCLVHLRGVAAADAVHRRGVHAAPRRRRALDPRDDAVHDLLRRGVEARARSSGACCSASRRSRPSPTSWAVPTMGPIRSGSSTTSTSSA